MTASPAPAPSAERSDVRVVVSGIGVVTSIGAGKDKVRQALFAGIDGSGPVTRFATGKLKVHHGFEVRDELPDPRGPTRLVQLADCAAREALSDSGWTGSQEDMALVAGSGLGDEEVMGLMAGGHALGTPRALAHRLAPQLTHLLGLHGGATGIGTACAAGLASIAYASELVRAGRCRTVIAGGAETFSINSMAYFDRVTVGRPTKVCPFDRNREGMLLGEGAGFVVLEDLADVTRRNGTHYGEILGWGLSCDAFHLSNMSGRGVAQAIARALADARLTPADVDYIAAHGTGTPINDVVETEAIKAVYGEKARSTPVSSIKSMIGHTGGASGVLGLISGLFAIADQAVPPTINYATPDPACDLDYVPCRARPCRVRRVQVNAFGFGGANCSIVVGGPESR